MEKKPEPQKTFQTASLRQNLEMEELIKKQINRVCETTDFIEFKWAVIKLEGLLEPYLDGYGLTSEQFNQKIKEYENKLNMTSLSNKSEWRNFDQQKIIELEQYRYLLLFKELNKLAKRLDIGLESSGEADLDGIEEIVRKNNN